MNSAKYFLIMLLFFSVSCSQNVIQEEELKNIQLKESKDILPISTFIKKIDYIKLRIPSKEYKIGEVLDVKFFGDEIIVIHRKAKEINIVRFSKSGEFINVVVNSNDGKVKEPRDIIEYHNDYAVLGKSGIYIFSNHGKFIRKIVDAPIHGKSFFRSNNSFYVLNENKSDNFLQAYKEDAKTAKKIENPVVFKNVGTAKVLPQKNGELKIVNALNDTIFEYGNKGLQPIHVIQANSFPTLMKGVKHISGMDEMEAKKYMNNNQHIVVKNYLENEDFIFMFFWAGSTSGNLLIDKKSGKKTYFYYGVNNIDGGIWEQPITLTENNELIVPLSSAKISGHVIKNKRRKDFEKLQQKLKPSDDLVLMKCKLK